MTAPHRPLAPLALALASSRCGAPERPQVPPPPPAAARAAQLLIVDLDADPLALGGQPGALFTFDPASGALALLHSSRALVDPVDVLADRDGALLVLDQVESGGRGAIVRVESDGRAQELALPPALVDPTSFARAPDGCVWVVDRGVLFADGRGPGAVWRFSADWSRVSAVACGAPLEVPSDLAFVDGRAWILDADAWRVDLAALHEGGLFHAAQDGSGFAEAARLALVSPFSLQPWRDGRFLVADVNADPKVPTRFCGGLYSLSRDGTSELFAWSRELRDPTCAALHAGRLYVTDGSADPLALGDDATGKGFAGHGRGALFAVDLESRAITLAIASADFCNPVRVRVVGGAADGGGAWR